MMPTCNFKLKQSKVVSKKGDQFSVSMEPPLKPGCTRTIYINGQEVQMDDEVGGLKVKRLDAEGGVGFEATNDDPQAVVSFSLVCTGEASCGPTLRGIFIGNPNGSNVPEESLIDDIVKKAIEGLTGIKDFLGEALDKLTPEGLKAIKDIIGKGLDAVTNLIPNLPLPIPGPIPLLGGLSISLEKIGKILKGRDPVDGSREAIVADAKALQVLIEEEIIPFVRLVGQAAKLDHETYRRRFALISKLLDLSTRDLNHLQRKTKKSRGRK
jgi:hypothetical protein